MINTSHDEDSPFIMADGETLYFSSNGDKSMGGYDVFVSHFNNETKDWTTPKNLGFPINTTHDDLYFSVSSDGETMYFSSAHAEGLGDKDIYYANIKDKSINVMLVKGHVVEEGSNKPVMAHLEIKEKLSGEVIGVYNSNIKTGDYTIIFQEGKEYSIVISSNGYITHEESFKVPNINEFQMKTKNFILEKNKTE